MEYNIFKCNDGGYIVRPAREIGSYNPPVFAATSIKDALKYIESKMEPSPCRKKS